MARFANFEKISDVKKSLESVFYEDDKGRRVYFKYIDIENLSKEKFTQRFPDEKVEEPVLKINKTQKDGAEFLTLQVYICIQDSIDEFGLKGFFPYKNTEKNKDYYEKKLFPFGKYEGFSIKSISMFDISYLRWVCEESNASKSLKDVCRYWIDYGDESDRDDEIPIL